MSDEGTDWSERDDAALLAAIGRRDERALAALYDRYGGFAYALAYRILGERGAAEDAVQDAFLNVWRRAASFEAGRGSARTWLLSIVHHRAIDRLRGTAGRARRDGSLDDLAAVMADDDPWRDVETTLQREALQRGLAALPEDQRRTIELAYFAGYTQTEIAGAMGVPVGTVKGRMRLGLHKLRGLLAGAGVAQR
ncbi:MAG TPA: sigma-70 family RNA polymerase sigma factor [Thermomicrobiales bacterium]|nr:sigma-70 family RNA polymerase sigma factor [Thermomicrobiales bacterium]